MFVFKKIAAQFFFPMPLCLVLCFLGLGMLCLSKRQKMGKLLVGIGLLALTVLSYAPVADSLLGPLERQYAPYVVTGSVPADYILVLGGGHSTDARLPVTSQLGNASLKRLVEGISLWRSNPGSKLVLSGGSSFDEKADAEVMAQVAKRLGVPESAIITEAFSVDTEAQAQLLKPILGTNRTVLVTSATHMPRSVWLFNQQGIRCEPAPTEHLVVRRGWRPESFFPSGRELERSERAFYEYLGLAWVKLKSWPALPTRR